MNVPDQRIFDQFAGKTPLPYVPVITAGWDRRPWEEDKLPSEKMSTWYPDRTPKLVEEFVGLGVCWLDKHPDKTTAQRLLLIYTWNENGEGGYLTPTAKAMSSTSRRSPITPSSQCGGRIGKLLEKNREPLDATTDSRFGPERQAYASDDLGEQRKSQP
jgi:hypothetical protein